MVQQEKIQATIEDNIIPLIVVVFAFIGYRTQVDLNTVTLVLGASIFVLGIREAAQRTTARLMGASVNMNMSRKGSATTTLVALYSYVTGLGLAVILPLFNTYESERYESWGKSVDVVWSKREFWLALSGILTLTLSSLTLYRIEYFTFLQLTTIFTLSQMIPLRELVVEGSTDGAYILFHSGFTWLILTGANLMLLGLTIY